MELVEREQQYSELSYAWNQVYSGRGRIVLVSGEAGIGKTSLIEGFVSEHRKPASVFWGS
ncbi:MAG: ATP-binding protein, partial [Chloroflexi bacterium]